MWDALFDNVYVVSLPASKDRRAYIRGHLAENGIGTFEWHDAVDPDHPDVKAMLGSGRVHQYPPCFRCGKASCGRDECNNVLLPVQVAVFVTYLNLWRKIATRGERALIVEDDLHLHDSWERVLPFLADQVARGVVPFHAGSPCLLRLGWALGPDHDQGDLPRLDQTVQMSNPCHGLTSAYAAKAVERFETVYHTADVYLHRDLPEAGEAFTVFPPIASELSWSVGAFESLIHPKEIRARFLERQGHLAEAETMRARAHHHAHQVAHRAEPESD